jgi:hypothetical protein
MTKTVYQSNLQIKDFKKQLLLLKNHLQTSYKETDNQNKTVIFISLGWKNERARVFVGSGNRFDSSWKNAENQAVKSVKQKEHTPEWLKADIVTDRKQLSIARFIQTITETKHNYFRYGISFDQGFNLAFLEQEINGNAFIKHDKTYQRAYLDEQNINHYVKHNRGMKFPIRFENVREITLFQTKGYFFDGRNVYELESSLLNNGRRMIRHLDEKNTLNIIDLSSQFLSQLVHDSGRFIYGYFACFDKKIKWYNMLRHASTVYSMVEAYELTRNKQLAESIHRAFNYLKENAIFTFGSKNEHPYAYVVDEMNDREIKLGANAAAILAFTKYTKVFKDEQYLKLAQALAYGIERMQKVETGEFIHILNYPDLTVKEAFRIIYYDGEAAFSLMRLYEIDGNDRWLKVVENAFRNFIKQDYWKKHDHWLSYCTNELTRYKPEDRYFEFGLKNVFYRLDFILKRTTTYPTFLELTTAAYKMIERIKMLNKQHLLEPFNESKLEKTIHHRAHYQLNGYFFPEVAMYFKKPHHLLNGFFIRHHSFRTRIDDVEHNLSGYCHYLTDILRRNKGEEHFEIH